jgi:hypothetical protein
MVGMSKPKKEIILLITSATPAPAWMRLRDHLAKSWRMDTRSIRIVTVDESFSDPAEYATSPNVVLYADSTVAQLIPPRDLALEWMQLATKESAAEGQRLRPALPYFKYEANRKRRR